MEHDKLQAFREGFCEKAAELGLTPSELLPFAVKRAFPDIKEILELIKDNAVAVGATGLVGGAGLGALGSYLYNSAKFQLDPEDALSPSYDQSAEAKDLHLMAKYRDGVRQLKAGVK